MYIPDTRLLRSKMVLFGDGVGDLCEQLNQSRTNVQNKLRGSIMFTLNDIRIISKRYSLTDREIVKIFIEGCDTVAEADCEGSCE